MNALDPSEEVPVTEPASPIEPEPPIAAPDESAISEVGEAPDELCVEATVAEQSAQLEPMAALSPAEDESALPSAGADSRRFLDAIAALGEVMGRRLDAIQTLVEREIRAEATRERVVDRLHAELQEYKHDLLLKVMRPVFIDLIQLHDDIGKMIEAQTGETIPEGSDRPESVVELLRSVQTGIEDILYRQGVEPFEDDGEAFDPRRQRAVSTVPTDDPERSKTVAGRLRKGFATGEKVIRPELVSVYTFKK